MSHTSPLLIIILGALSAFAPLATDMYLPAFPAITAGLNADPAAVQQTLATFFAGMAVAQVVYGPLADRFGRRPLLLVGLTVFTLASVACALAPSTHALALGRLGQGLGGCAGMVLARAIVRDLTEGTASIKLMSQLMLVMGLAPILAPSLGSLLLTVAEWRAIFWLLALYSGVLAVLVIFVLPESLPPERRRRDGLGGVLTVYARLLTNRTFLGLTLSGTLPMAGVFAYIAGSPFVFMELHGLTPSRYGLIFGANAFGLIAMAQVVARIVHKVAPERILGVVLPVMTAAGALLLLSAATGLGGFPALAALLFVYVGGLGAVMPLSSALAMQQQGRVAGSASAIMGTLQFGGGAVSGALVGLLFNGTAVPMAAIMALCAAGGWAARAVLK